MTLPKLLQGPYRHAVWLVILLATGVWSLYLGHLYQFSTAIDDAHITAYAGKMLAETGRILNYNGEPVEQSSSLLQVLLIASLIKLTGLNPVAAGQAISMASGLLCAWLLVAVPRLDPLLRLMAMAQCVVSPALVYWQYAGLDATLAATCMLLLLISLHAWLDTPGGLSLIALALVSLMTMAVRPEMLLFVPVYSLAMTLIHGRLRHYPWPTLLVMLALTVTLALSLLMWRYQNFGDFFPQPVNAKVGRDPLAALLSGLTSIVLGLSDPRWLASIFLVAIATSYALNSALRGRETPVITSTAVMLSGYFVTIMLMGKDWMPMGRFWVPLTPLACILVPMLLQRFLPPLLVYIFVAVIFLSGAYQARNIRAGEHVMADSTLAEIASRVPAAMPVLTATELASPDNRANIPTLQVLMPLAGQLLALQPEGISVLSGQMGFLSYHLASAYPQRIHFMDRNGLVERTFTDCMVTRDSARSAMGLSELPFIAFFRKAEDLNTRCGIAMPDLVYDLWNRDLAGTAENLLLRHGYHVVLLQNGHLNPTLSQIVAVRDALWQQMGRPAKIVLTANYRKPLP